MTRQFIGSLATCLFAAAIASAAALPARAGGAASSVLLAQAAPTTAPPAMAPPPPASAPPGTVVVPPPEAQAPAVGQIRFSGGEVAAGIGFSWGDGTIAFRGQQRPFHISGFSVANVGIADLTATGQVYHLRRLEDFAGRYVEVAAGATIGGGGSVAYLRNAKGVVIEISATTAGLDFQLSSNGVDISLG